MSAGGNVAEDKNRSCYHQQIDDDNPGDRTGICPEVGGDYRKGDIYNRPVKPVHDSAEGYCYEEENGFRIDLRLNHR